MISGADQHEKIAPAPLTYLTCAISCLTCAVFLSHLHHVFVPPAQLYLEKGFFNG
jgi:hypothetical protein